MCFCYDLTIQNFLHNYYVCTVHLVYNFYLLLLVIIGWNNSYMPVYQTITLWKYIPFF